MREKLFYGSITPLVTPFRRGGADLDLDAVRRLIDFQLDAGSHGLSCTGTTGEPTSLTAAERQRVIRAVAEHVAGRVPFLAGTGSNNTEESVQLSRYAREVGADGLLLVAPYHVRPSQQGLYEHFTRIADAAEIPVMLYNIPGRAGVNIEPETQRRIREASPNVFGVKEANTDFAQVSRDIYACGADWEVYSGIETLCLPMLAVGGAGHVSATANVAPRDVAQLYELVRAGDWLGARELHYRLLPLNEVLFIETNPGPIKFLLGEMGLIEDAAVRLPLARVSEANAERIRAAARDYGLIA